MKKQKLVTIFVRTFAEQELQKYVDNKLATLGEGWQIVSITSSVVHGGYGTTPCILITLLAEKQ